ncbi:zinc finger and SCAN domain-containing protein 32 isoform X4 [Canis lupus familiaris]|uniref:zinc finger and SCAN domain-containing protein 32 isoform X4 n=1 Tax=Canis lupus familiaris TaxID=9615 RepID=UPI0018F7D089|nr:zinc finger and SCAN domain-containing protein 32 isoform X4 [Canis lupus familiaris]
MEPHETEATGASSGPQTLLCSYSLGGHVEACLLPPCPELQIQCGEVEPRKMPCNRFPMLLDCDPTQSPCSWQRPSTRGCFLPKNLAQKRGFETRRQALAFGSWGPGEGPVPCEDRAVSLCQEGQTHVGFAQRALYKGVTWKKDRKNSLAGGPCGDAPKPVLAIVWNAQHHEELQTPQHSQPDRMVAE